MMKFFLSFAAGLLLSGADSAKMVGGKSPIDTADEIVLLSARAAVKNFDSTGNHLHKHVLREVLSGTKQVVAGVKYELVLSLDETDCDNKSGIDEKLCNPTGKGKLVEVTVVAQPWKSQSPYTVTIGDVSQL